MKRKRNTYTINENNADIGEDCPFCYDIDGNLKRKTDFEINQKKVTDESSIVKANAWGAGDVLLNAFYRGWIEI